MHIPPSALAFSQPDANEYGKLEADKNKTKQKIKQPISLDHCLRILCQQEAIILCFM